MLDFILAVLHHVLVVALIAIVGFSMALVRHEMTPDHAAQLLGLLHPGLPLGRGRQLRFPREAHD